MSIKVLVLEDDPNRAKWFQKSFTNPDITASVKEAHQKLKQNNYDLIFLDRDLGNPYETGEDLAWQMKQEKLAPDAYIVIHSANDRGQRVMTRYLSSYNNNVVGIKFDKFASHKIENVFKIIGFSQNAQDNPEKLEKKSQSSIADFLIEYFPRVNYQTKEAADFLFSIWKNDKNKITDQIYRKPLDIPFSKLEQMQNEGLVRCIGDRIEITAKGSEIIKTMILGDDRSTLEKQSSEITYKQAKTNIKKRKTVKNIWKIASDNWWSKWQQ